MVYLAAEYGDPVILDAVIYARGRSALSAKDELSRTPLDITKEKKHGMVEKYLGQNGGMGNSGTADVGDQGNTFPETYLLPLLPKGPGTTAQVGVSRKFTSIRGGWASESGRKGC